MTIWDLIDRHMVAASFVGYAVLTVTVFCFLATELERLKSKVHNLAKELETQQAENRAHLSELATVRTGKEGVWFWQGDGRDDPGSLVCPVVMSSEKLRELLDRAPTAQAETQNTAPKTPVCSLCGGEGPFDHECF